MKTAKRIYLRLFFSQAAPTARCYAAGSEQTLREDGGARAPDPAAAPRRSRGAARTQHSGRPCLTFQLDSSRKARGRQI